MRFVTGHGQYTDDLHFPDEAFACFVRSPHAHARLGALMSKQRGSLQALSACLRKKDVETFGAGPMPCLAPVVSRDGTGPKNSPKPLLAKDRITFVGEAVAMVVAETYARAKDAAELVMVDYEPLDAGGTLDAAPASAQRSG